MYKYILIVMFSKGITLIIISMIVFGILNLFENMIHYSIGRTYRDSRFLFIFPNLADFIKILIVMIVFGLAQGLITEYFIKD